MRAGSLRAGQPDYHLMVATVMLLIAGLLAVYTSSFAVAYHEYGDPNYFVARHAVFALIGVAALVFFMRLDYNRLRTLSVPMLAVALVGLLLVLSPLGVEGNGATRWRKFGPGSGQASECAERAVTGYVAAGGAARAGMARGGVGRAGAGLVSRGMALAGWAVSLVAFVWVRSTISGATGQLSALSPRG